MFNLFNKKTKAEKKEISSNYPAIIDEIHNQFFTAGDNILEEAKSLLSKLETEDIAKGKRLAALGFGKTREAVAAVETETKLATTKEIAELVVYYKVNYPNNKFITEEQVKAICEKYGLVCGETSAYKGFVPERKIQDIERFSLLDKDTNYGVVVDGNGNVIKYLDKEAFNTLWTNDNLFHKKGFYTSSDRTFEKRNNLQFLPRFSRVEFNQIGMKICAPLKDMEVKPNQRVVGHKIKDIPDPVVLQPVRGGYLIVCAWGDEASDEIVVNNQMN